MQDMKIKPVMTIQCVLRYSYARVISKAQSVAPPNEKAHHCRITMRNLMHLNEN